MLGPHARSFLITDGTASLVLASTRVKRPIRARDGSPSVKTRFSVESESWHPFRSAEPRPTSGSCRVWLPTVEVRT
jgi:hypothetical protein